MPQPEHLDLALAEEFSGHGQTIHRLKVSSPHFKKLMVENHTLWTQIHNIQSGVQAASATHLGALERQRLVILDEIAKLVGDAEA
ncbi:hypothetical protein U91I_00699 [alpha proteobacterium U9-1i]|nr:hypothetical protein U91I_00699 [alpha proteobacterium U9-1i]